MATKQKSGSTKSASQTQTKAAAPKKAAGSRKAASSRSSSKSGSKSSGDKSAAAGRQAALKSVEANKSNTGIPGLRNDTEHFKKLQGEEIPNAEGNVSSAEPQKYGGDQAQVFDNEKQ